MMLYPPVADLVDKIGSRYLLVNLVASRARDISEKEHDTGIYSDERAVSTAINEVYAGKLTIAEKPEAEN